MTYRLATIHALQTNDISYSRLDLTVGQKVYSKAIDLTSTISSKHYSVIGNIVLILSQYAFSKFSKYFLKE